MCDCLISKDSFQSLRISGLHPQFNFVFTVGGGSGGGEQGRVGGCGAGSRIHKPGYKHAFQTKTLVVGLPKPLDLPNILTLSSTSGKLGDSKISITQGSRPATLQSLEAEQTLRSLITVVLTEQLKKNQFELLYFISI